jgi:hypothetical protein
VGSFLLHIPVAIVMVLVIGGEGGVVGVSTGICMEILFDWGGRDG